MAVDRRQQRDFIPRQPRSVFPERMGHPAWVAGVKYAAQGHRDAGIITQQETDPVFLQDAHPDLSRRQPHLAQLHGFRL